MKLLDDFPQYVFEGDIHEDGANPDATTAALLARVLSGEEIYGYGISFTPLLEYLMGRS
jgi:hypothetical protein